MGPELDYLFLKMSIRGWTKPEQSIITNTNAAYSPKGHNFTPSISVQMQTSDCYMQLIARVGKYAET